MPNTSPKAEAEQLSIHHFHQVRFERGEKWLWNPAQKRLLRDRPEERVRLRCMEWLHYKCAIPIGRISTELPVKRKKVGDEFRADILAYDASLKPHILVECKSADVKITEKTAMQAARYNEQIRAQYIVLSNGLAEYAFRLKGDGIEPMAPSMLHKPDFTEQHERDFSYWQQRGFTGNAGIGDESWLCRLCSELYGQDAKKNRYITAPKMDAYPHLNHYYTIGESWSAGILAHADGSAWLAGLHASEALGNLILLIPLTPAGAKPALFSSSGIKTLGQQELKALHEQLREQQTDFADIEKILTDLATHTV